MSSVIWYLYEFARKGWIEKFVGAATNPEIVETPDRFRDFPEVIKEHCIACGACTAACPSPAAIKLVRTKDSENGEGITYPVINTDSCIRCGFCAEVCPTDPKTLRTGENHLISEEFTILPAEKIFVIDDYLCIRCKKCIKACKVEGAIIEEDDRIMIDQSRCVACGECLKICPIKGAVKGIYISSVEGQKEVINMVVHALEEFIEARQDELRELSPEEVVKLEFSAAGIIKKAREILKDEDITRDIVERVTDRLKLKIITWDDSKCKQCKLCVDECPTGAISYDEEKGVVRDSDKCIRCTTCYQTCPFGVAGSYIARFLLTETKLKEENILVTVKPSLLPIGG
ncbi:MAG: 4Fe-4S binding protein [Methanobacteriaceae archaeon]|jgi:energy-converting hydrogenase A subunit P